MFPVVSRLDLPTHTHTDLIHHLIGNLSAWFLGKSSLYVLVQNALMYGYDLRIIDTQKCRQQTLYSHSPNLALVNKSKHQLNFLYSNFLVKEIRR